VATAGSVIEEGSRCRRPSTGQVGYGVPLAMMATSQVVVNGSLGPTAIGVATWSLTLRT